MHNDIFTIGSFTVHGYGLMIAIGLILAVLICYLRAPAKGLNRDVIADLALLIIIFGFLGAKLLFILINIPALIESPMSVLGSEGFVVYGGIVCGTLAVLWYCHHKKLIFRSYFDLIMPAVALAQGFGRIGCFLAGCCYGQETGSACSIVFPENSLAPAGVRLIPTQLFSSAGDFLLAAVLLLFARKSKVKGDVGALYLLLYGIGRFTVEFFRGDTRGSIGPFSTSQFLSLLIVPAALVIFYLNRKVPVKEPAAPVDQPEA